MKDREWIGFLQWALPRMRLQWEGYRRVRSQVRKRIAHRIGELGLETPEQYRTYLDRNPEEWVLMRSMCRITISRFYRDRGVFELLSSRVLPELAGMASGRKKRAVSCWCAGCASGEEPYTVSLVWHLQTLPRHSGASLHILATDLDANLLERAVAGVYGRSSLRELPLDWTIKAFESEGKLYRLRDRYRADITFRWHDLLERLPTGPFDLIMCRNLAFTYFDESLQVETLNRLFEQLQPGGYLVIGSHERLPATDHFLEPVDRNRSVFRLPARN